MSDPQNHPKFSTSEHRPQGLTKRDEHATFLIIGLVIVE